MVKGSAEGGLSHARALRKARNDIVSGQAIEAAFVAIERCGAWLCGNPKATLGQSLGKIVKLIAMLDHGIGPTHQRVAETVREARNLKMHTGASTERGARCTVRLMERMEEALMKGAGGMDELTAGDVMASPVETAEPWETLYDVRVRMLGHGYTALPAKMAEQWWWITDEWLVEAIQKFGIKAVVSDAMTQSSGKLTEATRVDRTRKIAEVETPALVVEGERAIGVVTAFDMLLVV